MYAARTRDGCVLKKLSNECDRVARRSDGRCNLKAPTPIVILSFSLIGFEGQLRILKLLRQIKVIVLETTLGELVRQPFRVLDKCIHDFSQ